MDDTRTPRRYPVQIATNAQAERPRERLLAFGAAALTDAELLAVMLRTGVAGCPVIDLARELLTQFGGIAPLLAAGTAEIRAQRGLGPARAAEFKAMVEFVRRSCLEEAAQRDALASPDAVRDYLRLTLAALPYEAFLALFLDSQNRLLAARELFRGTLAQTSVYPREVVKAALAHNAAAVIFAHNHPSGVAEPSRADELLTAALKQALALVDIRTLDHFVVARQRVVSFAERGLV
jgi:DNA repair protein RadC